MIEHLAPGAYAILAFPTRGALPGWAPLSMDPPATCHEAVKLVGYVAASILGLSVFADPHQGRKLLRSISVAGSAVSGVGLLQLAVDIHRPFGAFGQDTAGMAATFVNPNHLAGFLGLTCLVSLGLAQEERGPWRGIVGASAVLSGAGVFLWMFRGGILSLVLALLLLGLGAAVSQRWRPADFWHLQIACAALLLLAGALAYTPIVHELWSLDNDGAFAKAALWRSVPQLLRDFPVLGIGRGAFATVYPRYRDGLAPLTFTHLENEWLQTLVDFGPLTGLLLIGGVLWAVLRLLRQDAAPHRQGIVCGLFFLAIQNAGDFNLTLSAVALPAVFLLSAFAGASHPPRPGSAEGLENSLPPWLVLRWSSFLLITLATAPIAIQHRLSRDTSRLQAALRDTGTGDAEARQNLAQQALTWHPADAFAPLLVGQRALEVGDVRGALHWINRSMALAPNDDGSHYLAGRALLALGARQQATSELRTACLLRPASAASIAAQLLAATDDPGLVAQLAEVDDTSIRLRVAELLLAHGAAAAAQQLLTPQMQETQLNAAVLAARAAVALLDPGAAVTQATAAQHRWPQAPQPYLVEAEAWQLRGNTEAALEALQRGVSRTDHPEAVIPHSVTILVHAGRYPEAKELAQRLLEGSADAAPAAHALLGLTLTSQGHRAQALTEYRYARDAAPGDVPVRLAIAALLDELGDLRGAIAELEAAKLNVSDPAQLDPPCTACAASCSAWRRPRTTSAG